MKKSAFISDVLFAFFLVWLFTLCVFRYIRLSLFSALVLSGVCGILSACSVGAILQHKRKSFFVKQSEERKQQSVLDFLCLWSDEKKTEYFREALSKTSESTIRRSGTLRLVGEEDFYFLHFRFAPVTADEVAATARWNTDKKKILLCNRIEANAAALCAKLGIELHSGEAVYAALKKVEALPDVDDATLQEKKKRRLRFWFHKHNARRFFVGGALLLLTSLWTPFPYYYLVFGSILLLSAVFVRIFGYAE